MIERYVVGMSEEDYINFMRQAITDKNLEEVLMRFRNRAARQSDGCLAVDYGRIPGGAPGTRGSLELAKFMMPQIARELELPVDKFHIYKETVSAELMKLPVAAELRGI